MNDEVRSLMAEVLDEGLDDWVTLGHVLHRASVLSRTDQFNARSITMATLEILIGNGLVVAGNMGDSGFEAWDLEPGQAVDRIRVECEARGWILGLTDIWLATTPRGDDIARLINVEGEGVPDRFIDPRNCL
ncbi:hypothetical protein ACTMTI_35605 [Nonomuraea sp. H19]|uniref:hypothetical protein n=1 Tax=Nonomuraea sp. H19 TaxID=3452206 RepID=UPI003F8A63C7